jgi:lysophospholipase L1-like esterase
MTMRSAIVMMLLVHGATAFAQANPDPARFGKEIATFEADDRAAPPPEGATLFVGSSSITYWDVASAFPNMKTIKRGFGGSHVSDHIAYADRVIVRYKPKLIVFYAGDADVAANKPADRIFADYRTLVAAVHERLPNTPMVIIGTKPSPAHWKQNDTIRQANRSVRQFAASDPLLRYVDAESALLGADGRPRPELYADNGLNLNERGYAVWNDAVRPAIEEEWARNR